MRQLSSRNVYELRQVIMKLSMRFTELRNAMSYRDDLAQTGPAAMFVPVWSMQGLLDPLYHKAES